MNKDVTKPELVKRITDKLDNKKIVRGGNKHFYKRKYHLQYTQEIVDNVLGALLHTIKDAISEGDSIQLNGYMTIKPIYCNPRTARNVYENKEIQLPARYKLKIKAGSKLNAACEQFNDKEVMEDKT